MGFFKKMIKKVAHGVRDAGRFARKNAAVLGTAVGTLVAGPGGGALGSQIGGAITGIFGEGGGGAMPEIAVPIPDVPVMSQTGGFMGNNGLKGFSVNVPNSDDNSGNPAVSTERGNSLFAPIALALGAYIVLSD